MDRRTLLMSLIGGGIATALVGTNAANAATDTPNTTSLDAVRGALTGGDAIEMQRGGRGGGGRGGGSGFRGGGGGFRGGGGGFRGGGGGFRGGGGGFRGGFRGGGFRGGFRGPGFRRRGWGGPAWGPGFGPRRRCWINQWGELVCRRRRIYW